MDKNERKQVTFKSLFRIQSQLSLFPCYCLIHLTQLISLSAFSCITQLKNAALNKT